MPSRCAKSENFDVIRNSKKSYRKTKRDKIFTEFDPVDERVCSSAKSPKRDLMKYDNFSTAACDRNNIFSDYGGAGFQIDGGGDIYPEQRIQYLLL
ncbi:hypothetical protein L484_005780 [Morus notabilis]|uniref:Uncharacterized protein n=1 Tax=Morus notabilis TaxID=981085 RepID=W9S3K1_9ROSA|nr:hypothetical protein L484_005780 [Morus notabilis]